ncbi:hypothetical protein TCAL_04676 [Tigriopus californicus]|uniref:Uncharacterized protein n=1 Tax=Tigriopus californicus TaxID=6832 RepID=A0A553NTY3_TIGCA|nr:hypothetical protein TCAL_04676 [Tigriopus californicus]|eukprot:TCALIF_04676-PA protein Name:"Protein of unknown function" AED:0.10 eAED:0.10 QI:26/1/0.5/1/0/0.5/2/0/105
MKFLMVYCEKARIGGDKGLEQMYTAVSGLSNDEHESLLSFLDTKSTEMSPQQDLILLRVNHMPILNFLTDNCGYELMGSDPKMEKIVPKMEGKTRFLFIYHLQKK